MGLLFDNVPRRFFNPLAATANGGKQNQLYADCLLKINTLFAQETQVGREELRDAIVDVLLQDHIEDIDDTDMLAAAADTAAGGSVPPGQNDLPLREGTASGGRRQQDLASRIIAYLSNEEVGWLEEGTDNNTFRRTYMITEQAMLLADYVQRASAMKVEEMSNDLYNTYLVLNDFLTHTQERLSNHPYTSVLVNAYTNISHLYSSLKMLRRSIRRIVKNVTRKLTFDELMLNLSDYLDGNFIGEFTRLVNNENVSLFRRPVITMLHQLMSDESMRSVFVEDCMNTQMQADGRTHVTRPMAEEMADRQTAFIEDFLTSEYTAVTNDIRRQMVDYIMVVRLKLKVNMNISSGSRDLVAGMIRRLAALPQDGPLPEGAAAVLQIQDAGFVSPRSVRNAPVHHGRTRNQAAEQKVLTREEIAREQERMKRLLDTPYTGAKMKTYADHFQKNGLVRAADLPLATKDDVLCDVAAASFAAVNDMDVSVDDGYLTGPGLELRDFTLREHGTGGGKGSTKEQTHG